MTAATPTAPAPKTAIDEPGLGCSTLSTPPAPVWKPQPKGPARRRSSDGSIFTTARSGATTWSANDDWPRKWALTSRPWWVTAVEPSGRRPEKFNASKPRQ